MAHQVFVYGSLMQGFGNHRLLEESAFLSPATVEGHRMYTLGGFPALRVGDEHDSLVHGEVYEVDDSTLQALDRLEGHPHFYKREEKLVYVENYSAYLPCYLYIFQRPVDEEFFIEDGDWRLFNATPVCST